MRLCGAIVLFASVCLLPGYQSNPVERFDTAGLPARPASFLEQQIIELIRYHQPGDMADAVAIQRKLARYYREKGDDVRAAAALRLAARAEEPVRESVPKPIQDPVSTPRPTTSTIVPAFTGNYFGSEGRMLHTWEFYASGTFLHTWMVSGAGTNVRHSERGAFALKGNVLELKLTSSAGGYTTPGVGGNSTLIGGSSETASEIRQLRVKLDASGVLLELDGIQMKPKRW
jgi:hypothetical protein